MFPDSARCKPHLPPKLYSNPKMQITTEQSDLSTTWKDKESCETKKTQMNARKVYGVKSEDEATVI